MTAGPCSPPASGLPLASIPPGGLGMIGAHTARALADLGHEVVERPEELDELRLERMLGRFLARHVAAGITPGVTMFTDLFRIVSDHGLAVPPEIAAVFRALATMEGTLNQLAPGFDIVAEARVACGFLPLPRLLVAAM